jgi:hypothetical protein
VSREVRLVGDIYRIEVIAKGASVREQRRLKARFGGGRWRKLKGVANVRLSDGRVIFAELHWYEAHGIGRRKVKIKRRLDH